MTRATIPTPRRIARTPVIREPSDASVLGDALSVAGSVGQNLEARRFAADERVEEIDHRIALAEQRRLDDVRFLEESERWVQVEAETQQAVADLRANPQRFARGHEEAVRKILNERYRAFEEGLADNERVRQRLRLSIASSAARIDAREQAWQRNYEAKAQGDALDAMAKTRSNQLARSAPGEAADLFAEFQAEGRVAIEAGAFNQDQVATMVRLYDTQLAVGLNEGLFSSGRPDVVEKMVENGVFDALDLDVSRIQKQVAGERRALDLAAQRAEAQSQSEARAQAEALRAKIRLGVNPSQAEFDAVNAALSAAGVPQAERVEFAGLSIEMGLNRQYSETADPDGIAAAGAARALQNKIADGTASESEQIAYAHLNEVAQARAKEAGRRRRDLAEQGVQGQMALLAELDRMPSEQRFIAANEAKDGLGYVATLPAHTRQFALSGREVRKARPKDFGEKYQIEREFTAMTREFAGMLGGSYDDLRDLAWDIYAGELAGRGEDGWDEDVYRTMVHIAFGRTRRRDGTTQGGVGRVHGHQVILPVYQSQDEFERATSSLTFADAVYGDGSPIVAADVLEYYRPEYTRDSENGLPIYRMIDESGRPLLKKGGAVYEFFVPRETNRELP